MNRSFLSASIAGFCMLFIGIGLCRFAYTPLIPSLIKQNWLSVSETAYVGGANLLGYLMAVFFSKTILRYCALTKIIQYSLALSVTSLLLCSMNLGLFWLTFWRFLAGICGALLMVMSPSLILKKIPASYKGRTIGIMFSGIGFGIIISGSVLPYFSKNSVAMGWMICASLGFFATIIAWNILKNPNNEELSSHEPPKKNIHIIQPIHVKNKKSFFLLSIAYLTYGIGMVPHTLFLSAYMNSQFKLSVIMSGFFWSVFGITATLAPFFSGVVSDKIGYQKSLISAFIMACLGLGSIILGVRSIELCLFSSFIMGGMLSSIPSLISGRILELTGLEQHPYYWGRATLYCAISQAIAAYLMAYLLQANHGYFLFFMGAFMTFILGFLVIVCDYLLTIQKNKKY